MKIRGFVALVGMLTTIVIILVSVEAVMAQLTIKVSPTSLNFGEVPIDSFKELSFIIQNTGKARLQGSAVSLCSVFVLTGGGAFTLDPNVSKTIRVRFQPRAASSYTCVILIFSNDPKNWIVLVRTTGTGIKPTIWVSHVNLDFSNVKVGSFKDLPFTIKNIGRALLIGEVKPPSSPFSIISGEGAFSLKAGESLTVKVRFQPTDARSFAAVINISSNDPDQRSMNVDLFGTGIAPKIEVSPTSLDFNRVEVGKTKGLSFTIRNRGTYTLTATAKSPSAPFSCSGCGSITLLPQAQRTITISFKPTVVGNFTDVVLITSNDPKNPAIAIKVTGKATTANPTATAFIENVQISVLNDRIELRASSLSNASIQMELFTLAGLRVASGEAVGGFLALPLIDLSGQPLANGVYLYILTIKGFNGVKIRSQVNKMMILR